MAKACTGRKNIQGHPCFGSNHHQNGRIHLAVAPRCNIKCGYCTRRHDCVNESRPGVTSRVQSPTEALQTVRDVMDSASLGRLIRVVGIAGPGDPLANEETFETFRLVGEEFPHLIKCLSTNGLVLPDRIGELDQLGLGSLTVTLNALDPEIGSRIYTFVNYRGTAYRGRDAAELLIANQLAGLEKAADLGITIKVNTVLIPGVNDGEIPRIAEKVKELGAAVMNVMPLIPQADFAGLQAPTPERLEEIRSVNEKIIGQFRHCRQCRADAIGLIGQDANFDSGCAITLKQESAG
ncbi:radical SAM protein [Geomesophilobacter sediminis]|uniref:FeMo cofactor biosynthesis protein NifB n=1 Tax=Geomesophilobacter sediminis TaxID=2798584 RepID=A0A8J7M3A9_9BACT|nr:radical SAM protein [Geomesophilobacter sediminis]MBJ6727980.1 radical SAM protein [Geomesophilobacter sediminis]